MKSSRYWILFALLTSMSLNVFRLWMGVEWIASNAFWVYWLDAFTLATWIMALFVTGIDVAKEAREASE